MVQILKKKKNKKHEILYKFPNIVQFISILQNNSQNPNNSTLNRQQTIQQHQY